MPLLTVAPARYVLLVLDDGDGTVTRLVRSTDTDVDTEIVSCPSATEVEVHLRSGRRFSAVLASVDNPAMHDGVRLAARDAGTPLVVVGSQHTSAARLRSLLTTTAEPVPRADRPWDGGGVAGEDRSGRLVAVCGPGGTGTSTVAAGLAAGLAAAVQAPAGTPPAPARWPGADLLLADFALHGDQAALHRLPETRSEVATGLLDLVGTCGRRRLEPGELRGRTLAVPGYRLLTGLRRPGHWAAVNPTAFGTLVDECLHRFAVVVADVTGEVEGEADVGSIDVEERNHMARLVTACADVVVVVGSSGTLGKRRLVLTIDELLDHGLDPARVQPVVNRCRGTVGSVKLCGLPHTVISLADRGPEPAAAPLPPAALVWPLVPAVAALLSRLLPPPAAQALVPLKPGSLGCA